MSIILVLAGCVVLACAIHVCGVIYDRRARANNRKELEALYAAPDAAEAEAALCIPADDDLEQTDIYEDLAEFVVKAPVVKARAVRVLRIPRVPVVVDPDEETYLDAVLGGDKAKMHRVATRGWDYA